MKGTVALVTGAVSGIGRAVALRFAREGAAVVAADLDGQGAEALADAVVADGGRAAWIAVDVADEGGVTRMVSLSRERFGGLDILVNNAGGAEAPHFPTATPDRWARVIDVNLRSAILAVQYSLEAMRERGGGAIVNIASLAGLGLGPHFAPEYAAAKAGLVRFTAALAPLREEAGVRVNCICPDWVDTPMSRRTVAGMGAGERASLPKMLSSQQIADVVVQLATDKRLAGRIMVWRCGEQPTLLRADGPS